MKAMSVQLAGMMGRVTDFEISVGGANRDSSFGCAGVSSLNGGVSGERDFLPAHCFFFVCRRISNWRFSINLYICVECI